MLVEQVNCYLTKGLKIMCKEQDLVRIASEAILLLLYAWNLCPIPGMDIFAVSLPLAANLPFLMITPAGSIGN
jgi:hypothetical protein